MKVIDLIIALQNCDPNKEVYFNETKDESSVFKFTRLHFIEEVETSMNENIVVLSAAPLIDNEEDDDD